MPSAEAEESVMARYIGPVCRLCRREAMKLFLKGERCYTEKCAIEKRNFPPGQHGKTRKAKLAGYGLQLREKQKVKRIYGVLEDQFRRYFEAAERTRGITGVTLLQLLERRLDNVVYRLGLSTSRPQARQLVRHGHFLVNGKKVDIPSFQVKEGDVITVLGRRQKNPTVEHAMEEVKGRGIPEWLSFDTNTITGRVNAIPTREQINLPVQGQLIVELYAKECGESNSSSAGPQPFQTCGGRSAVNCRSVGPSACPTRKESECSGKVFSDPSGSSSNARRSPIDSAASTRSRSSAVSAPPSATRCAACCSRRLKARRSPRSRSTACCTSSRRSRAWSRTRPTS